KVIAWTVGPTINTNLAIQTVDKALHSRNLMSPVLFHTDQGSQSEKEALYFENL
ncbi:hypothetical protein IV483_13155, partial [Enterococcus faecalis]|nr:hypothetical protein [Enterococcus faecalis]